MNLVHFIFASDEAAMVLQELELNENLLPILREYPEFFRNRKDRLDPLKNTLHINTETEDSLKTAMLSVLCGKKKVERESRKSFPEIILNVFLDSIEKGSVWDDIVKYNLQEEFWRQTEKEFGYNGDKVPDAFLNTTLNNIFHYQLGEEQGMYSGTIFAHFDNWRKNQDYK
jgi:hypothetical protein